LRRNELGLLGHDLSAKPITWLDSDDWDHTDDSMSDCDFDPRRRPRCGMGQLERNSLAGGRLKLFGHGHHAFFMIHRAASSS
jgi:hypothetical protein